jgi:GT2 family glycosyltransferase
LPKVFIIIINYRSWQDTLECLESIFRSDYPEFSVIVVDNHSNDESVEYIRGWARGEIDYWLPPNHPMKKYSFPPILKPLRFLEILEGNIEVISNGFYPLIIIRAKENRGFSSGNNIGLRYIEKLKKKEDFIWLLNNDTVICKNSIAKLVEFALKKKAKEPFLIGNTVNSYYQPEKIDSAGWGYIDILSGKAAHRRIGLFSFKYIVGSSMFTNEIAFMDERYFLYFEDADYSKKLRKKNFFLDYCSESSLFHKINASTKKIGNNKSHKLLGMFIFYRLHFLLLLPLVMGMRLLYYFVTYKKANLEMILKILFQSR